MQAQPHQRGKFGIGVGWILRQDPVGEHLSLFQLGIEAALEIQVGLGLLAIEKRIVVQEELGLKNMEPVEFGKQKCRRIRRRPHGIFGMLVHPGVKARMGLIELEVVHLVEPGFQGR